MQTDTLAIMIQEALARAAADRQAFPVGGVFIGVVPDDPADLLGAGTWSKLGAGRLLVGTDYIYVYLWQRTA